MARLTEKPVRPRIAPARTTAPLALLALDALDLVVAHAIRAGVVVGSVGQDASNAVKAVTVAAGNELTEETKNARMERRRGYADFFFRSHRSARVTAPLVTSTIRSAVARGGIRAPVQYPDTVVCDLFIFLPNSNCVVFVLLRYCNNFIPT